jgi:hypothetical protein
VEGIFVLQNPAGLLQPGMRAEFSLVTRTESNVLAIPRTAVQGSPTERIVFYKDFEIPNAFVKTPVVLGERNEQYVEVISGLFPGDEVVTTGSYPLSFAGGDGGSLKEALDAAHGHEHAADGSDITEDQENDHGHAHEGEEHHEESSGFLSPRNLLIWASVSTVLLVITGQLLWNTSRKLREVKTATPATDA